MSCSMSCASGRGTRACHSTVGPLEGASASGAAADMRIRSVIQGWRVKVKPGHSAREAPPATAYRFVAQVDGRGQQPWGGLLRRSNYTRAAVSMSGLAADPHL